MTTIDQQFAEIETQLSAIVIAIRTLRAAVVTAPPPAPEPPAPPPAPGRLIVSAKVKSQTALAPYAFGQAFKRGDVPAGTTLGSADVQFTPLGTWDDGSMRWGIVAGEAAGNIDIRVGTTPGKAITIDALSSVKAAFLADAFGAAFTVSDWATPFMTWVEGPLMSSWLYRKPMGSDPHLVAWLEVRAWASGAIELLPYVENGYLKIANPTNKLTTYVFSLNGKDRFNLKFDLPNHCRTPLVNGEKLAHWVGADPNVVVQHDLEYLQATMMVPSYSAKTPVTASAVKALPTTYEPLQQGGYPNGMGTAGYHGSIGPLPLWDVLYLTCADSDLPWSAVQRNAYSAGRYGIHQRDEATNRPIKFSDHATLCFGGGNGVTGLGLSSNKNVTAKATGTVPAAFKTSHHPSMGYLAALITGRFYHVETLQFLATANYMKSGDVVRQKALGVLESYSVSFETRGAAWAWRTLAQTAALTPDADPLAAEFRASMKSNIEVYHARYVAQPNNRQGLVRGYSNNIPGTGMYGNSPWMQDFMTAAMGMALAMRPVLEGSSLDKLKSLFQWKARSIVGRLGTKDPEDFLYRDAGMYRMPFAPSESPDFLEGKGPWYPSWGAIWEAAQKTIHATGPKEISDGSARKPLKNGVVQKDATAATATGYWANLTPALSFALQHGAEGAADAMARVQSMPEWDARMKAFDANPTWAVKPATI